MADKKVQFKLDLDIKEFTEKGLQAKGIIEKIGSAEGMEGLIAGLSGVGVALAAAGLVAYSFKKALDLTVEGENIARIERQFETLASQAGISSQVLKQGLEESSKGLIGNNELLEIANKAIVTMGNSAKRLPEIMELARKVTAVAGGDIQSNFENITQAISVGNTRLLKHYGIVVDSEKAVRNFAQANNLAANELSEAGKRQAILNAVLSDGQNRYKGIQDDLSSTSNILTTLKVTFQDLGEIIAIVFEKTLGPAVRASLGFISELASKTKSFLQSVFTDVAHHENKIAQQQIEQDLVNKQQRLENENKFQSDLLKIRKESLRDQEQNINSLDELEYNIQEQKKIREQEFQMALQEISNNAHLNETQKIQLLTARGIQHHNEMRLQEQQTAQLRSKLLDDYTKHSTSSSQAIGRAFQVQSMKSKAELKDFGKRGQETMQSFERHSVNAFETMGAEIAKGKDIAAAAADAMKSIFLNMIADRAEAEGRQHLLAGIWPPNPIEIGAGVALLALGGALRSAAGSGGSSISGGTSSGGGGGGGPESPSTIGVPESTLNQAKLNSEEPLMDVAQSQRPQKSVNIHIAGNLYDTDSTRRSLMEMIRQETDGTDFRYDRIGVG